MENYLYLKFLPSNRPFQYFVHSPDNFDMCLMYTHRMVWAQRDLKIINFQFPSHQQGQLPADQVAQYPIHPAWPEHCQGWGIHIFSGKPVPVTRHSHSKEFPPYI